MKTTILVACLTWCSLSGHSQTLPVLLKLAEANYPLLKSKGHEVQARKDQVSFAQSSALPSLDAAYQVNYATYNNITGMAVSQGFVPISGPPSTSNSSQAVFGSAAGLLMNWELFTFGQRKTRINTAKTYQAYQLADRDQELFIHCIKTTHAYLDALMTHQLVKVYENNLQRAQDNARIIKALVNNGLRPGTDTAVFRAELSRAKIELLNHERLRDNQQLQLSELLGGIDVTITADSSYFTTLPGNSPDTTSSNHPMIRLAASRVSINEQARAAAKNSWYPKLTFWGTAYARGSGIRYDNVVESEQGLSFSRYNYGVGLMLSVPLLQFTQARHQVHAQESLILAEQEKVNQAKLHLSKQNQMADVTLRSAIKVANESPAYLNAASYSYRALLSRYQTGLVNYTELIEAQHELMHSQADLKRAYLDAWKALLYKAAVQGDMQIFLNQVN